MCKVCYSDYHKARYVSKKTHEYYEAKRVSRESALAIKNKEKLVIAEEIARQREIEKPIREAEKRKKKNEYNRKYRAEHPGCRRVEKKNRKLKVRTSGRLSVGIVKMLIEKQKGKCVVCKVSIKDGFHIDHIIPIAKGGMNVDNNVQLLCPPCNMSKSDKHPVDFMQSNGFLL